MKQLKEKEFIYCLKALAIFSVVCAHSSVSPNGNPANVAVSKILNGIGVIGVPLFFLSAGYLFNRNTQNFKDFWLKKIRTIFIPWFFCETIVWFYVVLRKGGLDILSWLKWLIGFGHSTYYLTMLIFLYIIFFKVKGYKAGNRGGG